LTEQQEKLSKKLFDLRRKLKNMLEIPKKSKDVDEAVTSIKKNNILKIQLEYLCMSDLLILRNYLEKNI
jgi:hypothetical protein